MTTFFERPEDYLGETVTAEPAPDWFFEQFPERPKGYRGIHRSQFRWNVRRHRQAPWGAS